MYDKILVPLDGSQLSERVLPYARLLAARLKIPVELLHVIDLESPRPLSPEQEIKRQAVITAEYAKSMEYLKEIAASFAEPGAVNCAIEIDKSAEAIVDRAANVGALIAMSTHGRSGINRWLLGSVADKVLHAAANPLLLVRSAEDAVQSDIQSLTQIMVALDGSPLAETVLPYAAELAQKIGLKLLLTRVFSVPLPVFSEEYGPYMQELWGEVEKEAKDYLEEKARDMKAQGIRDVGTQAVVGFASEKLIELAQESGQTLVAMCTHGRSGVNRWVMGSVTDRVVRHLVGPVLIIRAPGSNTTE
jgi:nucleotide-binding universal stress UspA family protein